MKTIREDQLPSYVWICIWAASSAAGVLAVSDFHHFCHAFISAFICGAMVRFYIGSRPQL